MSVNKFSQPAFNKLMTFVDYRFEDAYASAKQELKNELSKSNIQCDYSDITATMWQTHEILSLFDGFIDNSVVPIKNVNTLINEIKENKKNFSKEEKLLIRDILDLDSVKAEQLQ